MEQKTFNECFDYMAKFHKLDPSATAREAWWIAFKDEHDDVFCKAMMLHNQKQATGRFPTIERFRAYVTDAREKAWEGKKHSEPAKPLSNYKPPAGDIRNVERGIGDMQLAMDLHLHGYTDEIMPKLRNRWPAVDWQAERTNAETIRAARVKWLAEQNQTVKYREFIMPQREFPDVHAKADFYRRMFSTEAEERRPIEPLNSAPRAS